MQERHIYLLDGHDMEPFTALIVDDKVRFVDMALKDGSVRISSFMTGPYMTNNS